ncbi:B12-binding domain-containing protein [Hyphomicrobium sp.]|uniref:cobalamin B12-binding domain-containing protein n=1 Tax=Hyphomicrobium sp. TaxID=82 RepID=UPI0025C73DEF|nr:cobalamin B12-binding domain-containing protein [Hyphomicrobium sp.]
MSTIRPLTELKRYRQDCGFASGSGFDFRSERQAGSILTPMQMRALRVTVDESIVPALVRANTSRAGRLNPSRSEAGIENIEEFVPLLLRNDTAAARRYVLRLLQKDMSFEALVLDLFTESARHLGELWKQDVCTFVDVTIALAALQWLLRDISADFDERLRFRTSQRRAFLSVMPGDQHTFGLQVLQEFFRRAGWIVCGGTSGTYDELFEAACRDPFDLIGISVGKDVAPEALSSMLHAIKRRIRRPSTQVLVGGRYFLENPHLVLSVGADGTATDALKAVSSFQNA